MTERDYRKMVKGFIVLSKGDIPYREIAEKTGQSQQNLHNKIATGRMRAWEFLQILDAMGAKLVIKKNG